MNRMRMRRVSAAAWALAMIGCSAAGRVAAAPPAADMHDAGTWDLSFEKGNRRCRLFLRTEPHADGFAVAMPAGCHKAFPMLAKVTLWSSAANEHVLLRGDDGATVYDFGPNGIPGLTAVAGEGDTYSLTPINPTLQDRLRAVPAIPLPAPAPAASAPAVPGTLVEREAGRGKLPPKPAAPTALPPTTPAAVAGNYAVLRLGRDTGCMVTLEAGDRAAGDLRARLAPACRDQGIVIFDPAGWALRHGTELVLTAKKGHSTALTRRDEKTWANAPEHGAPLTLKRL